MANFESGSLIPVIVCVSCLVSEIFAVSDRRTTLIITKAGAHIVAGQLTRETKNVLIQFLNVVRSISFACVLQVDGCTDEVNEKDWLEALIQLDGPMDSDDVAVGVDGDEEDEEPGGDEEGESRNSFCLFAKYCCS